MHKIYAIEPEAINSWDLAQYLIEKFGFSKGLLIGRFPKSWPNLVLEACDKNKISDIAKAKIIEKLKIANESGGLVKTGQNYNPEITWIANALTDEAIKTFALVVAKEKTGHKKAVCIDDKDENWFADKQHFSPKRNADDLALAAKWILRSAGSLTIIDPYFQCKESNIKVLSKLIGLIGASQQFTIEINVSEEKHPAARQSLKNYERLLKPMTDQGWSFNIRLWRNDIADRHGRFLITDRAGLLYDRGFDEPNDLTERELTTSVDCISAARINEQLMHYDIKSKDLTETIKINKSN